MSETNLAEPQPEGGAEPPLVRPASPAEVAAVTLPQAEPGTVRQRRPNGFVTLNKLARICRRQPTNYLVERLLPADDVHVAVGDSGIGKTPWGYQLGFCVATGKPFLAHAVKQGRVLYLDLENGREEILEVGRVLRKHLGLESLPRDFLVLRDEGDIFFSLENAIAEYNPVLTIIDTLRSYRPTPEKSNDEMAQFLRDCKHIARRYHCAILLLHHIKKPGENGVPPLESTPVLTWLLQASGARALVNQTNARIALDVPRGATDAALVMKFFVKMRGESGPLVSGARFGR